MAGHLGSRVTALVDGQLDERATESAWSHIHGCGRCRTEVEREGWVKTQLVAVGMARATAPAALKDVLTDVIARELDGCDQSVPLPAVAGSYPRMSQSAMLVLGGGAVGGFLGAALVGAIMLGAGAGQGSLPERRTPTASLANVAGAGSATATTVTVGPAPQRMARAHLLTTLKNSR